MGSTGLTSSLGKIERVIEGGPAGERVVPVLDTPEARGKYGITHDDPWVAPFWLGHPTRDVVREYGARRVMILFLSEAEWGL